jgi:hypothetical protein
VKKIPLTLSSMKGTLNSAATWTPASVFTLRDEVRSFFVPIKITFCCTIQRQQTKTKIKSHEFHSFVEILQIFIFYLLILDVFHVYNGESMITFLWPHPVIGYLLLNKIPKLHADEWTRNISQLVKVENKLSWETSSNTHTHTHTHTHYHTHDQSITDIDPIHTRVW